MRQRGEDLNWFPRPTALYKFRSWRVLNKFKQLQEEHCCSNTWIIAFNNGPPSSYSALTGLEAEKNKKTRCRWRKT
ncbi:hypothetical protein C1H46_033269 [Malus baccata]|uniref:Uncharacterized protein n=1 Tax=Malus baccata TaxID=106549 RepID=A0A540L483_MALBA|nr:hypothetical protein C1H46_033269 [Malus baccata]